MIQTYVASRYLVLSLCFFASMAQPDSDGFIENPLSISVDRGEQAILNCTYRTSQLGLPTIMWTTPSGISVMPTTFQIDEDTLQSTISFIAATSSYAGDYQCTVGSDSTNSDPATLTINYYGVEFKGSLHTVLETFFVFLEVTQFGSPSRDATISITRDDNGPAINDTVVSMAGPSIIHVEGSIPNDEIRQGDREITLMLTTSDDLIEIGPQNTTIVNATEVDLDSTSIIPAVHRVTAGSDATFIATDYNALLTPQFTWSFNGRVIRANNSKYSGEFTWNLTIMNVRKSDAGNYTCEISIGGLNSGQATGQLFVFAPVTITSQPVNLTINATEVATFSVEATGGGLTYQWMRIDISLNEVAGKLEGVNSPTLMVFNARIEDEGFYSCVVTNGAGDSEISNEAFLYTVDYTVKFGVQKVISEPALLPVITTARGSPSRNAIISFTRTDNGPAINNLTVNMTGTQEVKVQISNDARDSVFNVTMFTTNKTFVIIGRQRTVTVNITGNPPNDALLQRASIAIVIFSIVIALHQSIST